MPTVGEKIEAVNACALDIGEKGVLSGLKRHLKNEKRAYVIVASVIAVLIGAFLFGFPVSDLVRMHNDPSMEEYGFWESVEYYLMVDALASAFFCVRGFPDIIIGFVSAAKINRYLKTVEADVVPAKERALMPGVIVVAALVNHIAMAFAIQSNIYVRRNARIIDKIAEKQAKKRAGA